MHLYFKVYLELFHRTQFLIRYLFLTYKCNFILYRARSRVLYRLIIGTAPFHPHLHMWRLRNCLAQDSDPGRSRASSPDVQTFT